MLSSDALIHRKEGFWVLNHVDSDEKTLFKVIDIDQAYRFDGGSWVHVGFIPDIGSTYSDYDKITEEEALSLVGLDNWGD